MGYSFRSAGNLGPPFLLVDEIVFMVPGGEGLSLGKHHFKLLFILDGTVEHEIDGWEGRRPLSTGDILVAPVVGRHRYINPKKGTASVQVIRIFLDADYLATRAKRRVRKPKSDLADFIVHHFREVSQLHEGIDNEITRLIRSFREETEHVRVGNRHRLRAICTELIVAVARKLNAIPEVGEDPRAEGNSRSLIVAAAKEFILKNATQDLSLGEIAWQAGKGEEHLARVFKRETGQSVFDYIRELRINRAKTLMLNPALSLTQIAEQCGFHSLSFFSRTFRQHAGLSPSQYRQHSEMFVASPHLAEGQRDQEIIFARARKATREMRMAAAKSGAAELTMGDIDTEMKATRAKRRKGV